MGDPPSDAGAFQAILALVFVMSETTMGPIGSDGGTEEEAIPTACYTAIHLLQSRSQYP